MTKKEVAQEWAVYVAWANAVNAAKAVSKNLPKSQLRHLTPRSGI